MSNLIPLTRVCSVGYLNAEPLVWGLKERRGEGIILDRAVPSECAARLAEGRADLGLVPAATYQSGWKVVPGVSISCDGPAESVLLLGRVPAEKMRRVALDASSRTAAALTRVLFRERFMAEPEFAETSADVGFADPRFDGVLVIGDAALHFSDDRNFPHRHDLGAEWKAMTGLPFVFAFWAGRADLPSRAARLVQDARAEGLAHAREIAEKYSKAHHGLHPDFYHRYLTRVLRYDFTPREMEGLTAFYRLAHAAGVIEAAPAVEFYDV